MELSDLEPIGESDAGYEFFVGRLGERWVGFGLGAGDDGERMCFFMSEVSEGAVLGLKEKTEAIQRTALVADVGFGGVDRWMIDDWLRPKPGDVEKNLCEECGELYCDRMECFEAGMADFD